MKRLTDAQRKEHKEAWIKKASEKVRAERIENWKKLGYKNFYPRIYPGKLTYRLLNDVKEGIKDTVSGFAKRYGVTIQRIYSLLGQLRKKGYFIHPIGTIFGGFGKKHKEGILVDVTESREAFIEATNNRQKFMANPALVRQVESMEIFLEKHPEEYDSILEISETLQAKALEAKKQIREKVKEVQHANI
jgi:hypothetical protein